MAKSMRCKREKRPRAIKREMGAPLYEKKDEAKFAAIEAALNAPKLAVRIRPTNEVTSMDASASADLGSSISEVKQMINVGKEVGLPEKRRTVGNRRSIARQRLLPS